MNYNFFADKNDKLKILEYIFRETDLSIYDMASRFGQEITEYKTVMEIESAFDLDKGDKFAVSLQLWSPKHKGEVYSRRVELNPAQCEGHTFRYAAEGWGLIQLFLGGMKDGVLSQSHIGHFNEKGASRWETTEEKKSAVGQWSWTEIKKTSGQLKNQIQNKMAIRKIRSLGILEGADQLETKGIKLQGV